MNKPNIILIYADDQGTLDAGCYGAQDISTPHLDHLAETGIRFTQAYAHTVCCPSRAGVLTGCYPQRCGINDWCSNHPSDEKRTNMDLNQSTIASLLQGQDYVTGIIGKWHLGATLEHGPDAFGFDYFYGHRGGFIDNYQHMFLHSQRGQPPFHDLWRNKEEIFEAGHYFPDLVVKEARNFLELNKTKPFFLYLPFNLPHYPYQPDADLVLKYQHLSQPRDLYAAMVGTIDRRVGQVIEKVDELGLRKNTLIIYMSDNGHSTEEFWNWGNNYGAHGGGGYTGKWIGAKGSFLEGGIRVPAIISMPDVIPEGEERHQVITNMDFLPTILEMINYSGQELMFDGKSLVSLFSDHKSSEVHDYLFFQWQDRWMVRRGEWKLFYDLTLAKEEAEETQNLFLASLNDSEPEKYNYAQDKGNIVDQLKNAYESWKKEVFLDTGN